MTDGKRLIDGKQPRIPRCARDEQTCCDFERLADCFPPSRQKLQEAGSSTPLRFAQNDSENGARCFCCWSGVGSFHPQFAEANDDARDDKYLYKSAVKLIQVRRCAVTRSGGLRRGGLLRLSTRGRAWPGARCRWRLRRRLLRRWGGGRRGACLWSRLLRRA